jgi:general nucleoside transport system ATP-binding protein
MDDAEVVLDIANVRKTFGTIVAIENATMSVRRGEIHALVGENGAGKSTLMNIIYGMFPPDSGQVALHGRPVHFRRPSEAIAAGIGMVHQHFKLSPSFTVAENIILGAEPVKAFGRVDFARAEAETAELSQRFGIALDPKAIVGKLPVGLRQRVEILKALYRKAKILILDEPTAVLTPSETRELFVTMEALACNGHSIIFISHKLREVLDVSDRISVMRRGSIQRTFDNENVTAQELANVMVGRAVLLQVDKTVKASIGEEILSISELAAYGDREDLAVDNASLSVRRGEIVGLAGVQGNGQDELVECIAGLRRKVSGKIEIQSQVVDGNPAASRAAGLAYVPADRGGIGLSLSSPIWENLLMGHTGQFAAGPMMRVNKAKDWAQDLVQKFDIRGGGAFATGGSLSGGNQQKVQIARELTRSAPLIIAEQPSQGVDIGAIESIHRTLVAMRNEGKAVLLVSADLDEIMAISDRILVIYRGRIVADLVASETTYEEVGRYMGGIDHAGDAARARNGQVGTVVAGAVG